ncbi:MAG: hypothetical protein C0180_04060 [Aciduliprofundum sp.]|nr:MAG: hypothetical protein C0180_04060 [Aciduliprofundum sp.]
MRERFHRGIRIYDLGSIIDFLGINGDMDVADLGAGDGYYSREFVKRARSVTAIDIDDSYFQDLQSLGIKTVRADLCSYSQGSFDLLFMANVYHGLRRTCRENLLKNMEKMSRRYIAIMDFNEKRLFGPPFRVKKEEVISDMQQIGFRPLKTLDLEYHYIILFERA